MRTVGIHEAKRICRGWSKTPRRARRSSSPGPASRLPRLCPLARPKPKRELGCLEGKIVVPDNFDRLYEEEIRELFEKGC